MFLDVNENWPIEAKTYSILLANLCIVAIFNRKFINLLLFLRFSASVLHIVIYLDHPSSFSNFFFAVFIRINEPVHCFFLINYMYIILLFSNNFEYNYYR